MVDSSAITKRIPEETGLRGMASVALQATRFQAEQKISHATYMTTMLTMSISDIIYIYIYTYTYIVYIYISYIYIIIYIYIYKYIVVIVARL